MYRRRWRNESSKRREENFQKGPPMHRLALRGERRRASPLLWQSGNGGDPPAKCELCTFSHLFLAGRRRKPKPALFSARTLHSGSTQHHLLGRPCCYCMRGGTKREREKETRVHRRTTPSAAAAVGLPSSSFPPPSNQRTHYGKRMGKREKLPGFSEKGKYPKHPPTTRHLRNCQAGLGWKYKSPIQVDHKKIVFRQN